jgi:ribosomal protein S18 acetylase RimI-like enzyme
MIQGVALRPVSPEDREFLMRVYRSTREEELALTSWGEAEKSAFIRLQFDAQYGEYGRAYPQGEFQIILIDGEPAGRLYLNRMPEQLRIVDIAILPEFRGRGVGGSIIEDVIARGEAEGVPVTIHVERFNPAMRLYERLGFRPVEDRGVYLLMERAVLVEDRLVEIASLGSIQRNDE